MERGKVDRVEDIESVFQWKVEEFSSLDDRVDSKCYSPRFQFCGLNWYLCLLPNGDDEDVPEEYIGLDLILCWEQFRAVEVGYSVGIRTARGGREIWREGTKTFGDEGCFYIWCRGIERSELLRRRDDLLPGDVLTVTFTMRAMEAASERGLRNASGQRAVEESAAEAEKVEPSKKTGCLKLAEDIGKLWPDGEDTDALLKVRGVEFRAHRTILAARTPVLGAMFRHETTEKASGEVDIEDCQPEVFEQLLYHIYKGAPRELTAQNAHALYVLSDKYLVSEVKELCVRCMLDTLCLDTFVDTLTLSLTYREEELLKAATDFLSRNMISVMKTVEWQRFMREHQTWANETQIRAMELIESRSGNDK